MNNLLAQNGKSIGEPFPFMAALLLILQSKRIFSRLITVKSLFISSTCQCNMLSKYPSMATKFREIAYFKSWFMMLALF